VDTVARLLGQKFSAAFGKPVVVDNATGAAGNIAADRVAKAAPDGYTLGLLAQGQLVINPSLYKLTYDPSKDFAPVSQVTVSPIMLVVHNAVPAKSVKELVALAKAQPGGLAFASAGSGSGPHVGAELFKSMAGLDIRHIPYKGVPAALGDLLAARIDMLFLDLSVAAPHAEAGTLRLLAAAGSRRAPAALGLPTLEELGLRGMSVEPWYGLVAPAKTPPDTLAKLRSGLAGLRRAPEFQRQLQRLGYEAIDDSPEQFAAEIIGDIARFADIVRAAGSGAVQ
jgi:tripartite-type tricarboxylate transporter receptor subunit TctC